MGGPTGALLAPAAAGSKMVTMASPEDPQADLAYPVGWEADAVLSDGGTVHLRPITPADADRLRAFHERLSPETVYNRFFTAMRSLSARDVERFTTVDHDERAAVVAILRDEIVGVVRYARLANPDDAEVAVVVEDAHQGRGLGSLLLEHLEAAARERGVLRFVADVLPGNRTMLAVFRSAGFEITRELADGYVELSFPIQETEASLEVVRGREHRAEARSVARLLAPKAVAVVGASREPGTAGHEVFRSLLQHRFDGPVYPVNPLAPHVLSVRAYADVRDVPDEIDLAVIAVPASQVADAVRACSEQRVRGLVVVSGGFLDSGEQGRERLEEVVRLARDGGMRLIGPNAMGIVNTDPAVSLHATFAPGSPPHGRVGVFTQSGALASTFLALSEQRRLGLSTFVSIGDRADVSGNDMLQYWQADPGTDVVMLHLQGFGNPRKFARISRLLGRSKPVVCLKSGRAYGDAAVDAMFASAGVIRADTLAQMFEAAQLLALQPLPAGPRVGVVGTSTALAALAADACRAGGLSVPELPPEVQRALQQLAGTTETANPVDLGPLASAGRLRTALSVVAGSGCVDALLVLVTASSEQDALGAAVLDVASEHDVTVLASFVGVDGVPPALEVTADGSSALSDRTSAPDDQDPLSTAPLRLHVPTAVAPPAAPVGPGRGSVPSYASPESAALALSRAVAYAAWRSRPLGELPELPGFGRPAIEQVVAGLPHDGTWLASESAGRVLAAAGVSMWPTAQVRTAPQALAAADRLGWPVVLKSPDPRWRNRTDVGAVQLGLEDEDELRPAYARLSALTHSPEALLQPMAPPGVSVVIELVADPAVGPLLSLRLGGVAADLLADPRTTTLPLTDTGARELIGSIRGASLLDDADTTALVDVLLRVGRLAEQVPQIARVLLDPVLVGREGVTVLHAGIRLATPAEDPERGPRRLGGSGPAHLRGLGPRQPRLTGPLHVR